MITPAELKALQDSKIGAELSAEQCRILAGLIEFRNLGDGEVLVAEGSSDSNLYVIVSGSLGVVRNAGTPAEVTLITLTSGDLVDEMSFIDGTEHYAALVALGATRVFGLSRERLESLLTTSPEIVYLVMRAIIRTVHQLQRRMSMQTVELTNYIYKQHGRY